LGAIAQDLWPAAQDIVESCCFVNTSLKGGIPFRVGWVLVSSCVFAGGLPAFDASFIVAGVQRSFTATQISFDTASMLPTCGGVAGIAVEESPAGSGPFASFRLIVKMAVFIIKMAIFSVGLL
jgi:hypothetical protein